MKIESHRDLVVWQRAIELSVAVYELSRKFPREEIYGMASQMRRAAVSVASNIAESYGRTSTGEYLQFLGIARGSNLELQTQLVIGERLSLVSAEEAHSAEAISTEVAKMLVSLMKKLKASNRQ